MSSRVTNRFSNNREIKFDVKWSYVKRQTAKMTAEFVFFSSNPLLNHKKIEKCLLLFATNTNIFTLLFKELKTDGKSFIFAVCRLTYDHITSNLIPLIFCHWTRKMKTFSTSKLLLLGQLNIMKYDRQREIFIKMTTTLRLYSHCLNTVIMTDLWRNW